MHNFTKSITAITASLLILNSCSSPNSNKDITESSTSETSMTTVNTDTDTGSYSSPNLDKDITEPLTPGTLMTAVDTETHTGYVLCNLEDKDKFGTFDKWQLDVRPITVYSDGTTLIYDSYLYTVDWNAMNEGLDPDVKEQFFTNQGKYILFTYSELWYQNYFAEENMTNADFFTAAGDSTDTMTVLCDKDSNIIAEINKPAEYKKVEPTIDERYSSLKEMLKNDEGSSTYFANFKRLVEVNGRNYAVELLVGNNSWDYFSITCYTDTKTPPDDIFNDGLTYELVSEIALCKDKDPNALLYAYRAKFDNAKLNELKKTYKNEASIDSSDYSLKIVYDHYKRLLNDLTSTNENE